jgi:AcrR family transcriptional regulator
MEAAPQPSARFPTSAPTGRLGDVHEAALTLFAQWGYHGTTMSQIAEALGVRVPTLYSHIRSKQELLAEIMTTGSQQVLADYERAIAGAEGVTEQLRRAIEVYVHRHASHRREALIINRDISSLEEPTRSEVLALRKRHQRAIRDLIDEGCRAGVFAVENPSVASFAILEMGVSVARWFRDDGPLTPEDVARQYGQFAVNLVSQPAAP